MDDTFHYENDTLRYDNFCINRHIETMCKNTRNFRDYKVWQDAVDYSEKIYSITADLPYFEKKGLCDQLRRAVVSISSNVAEGSAQPSDVHFAHFLDMALGSAYEVETQLIISKKLNYLSEEVFCELLNEVQSIEKQLSAFIRRVRKI